MLSGSLRKPQNVALRNPFPLSGTKKVANRDQPTDFVDYTYSSCKHRRRNFAKASGEPSKWIILLWLGESCMGNLMESSLEHGLTNDDAPYHQIGENWWPGGPKRSWRIKDHNNHNMSQRFRVQFVQRAVTSQGWPVLASRDQSDWRRELKDLKLIGSEHRMCSPGRHPFSRYLAESCRRLWEDFQVSAPSTAYLHLCRSPAMGQCGGCDTARGCESGLAPTWESCD